MSKFKVGQKVVCIDAGIALTLNKVYTVKTSLLYACVSVDESGMPWSDERFEDFDEWAAKQPKKEIMNTLVPHIHEKEIIAWAKGETVQVFFASKQLWEDCLSPLWVQSATYRVKPKINYPETLLTENEIIKIANECNNGIKNNVVRVANAILKHAIDNNQVFVKETT